MVVPYRIRMLLPPEVRVLLGYVIPSRRAERRSAERHLIVPSTLGEAATRSGSVWGVAMMRNEEDAAAQVVEHMFDQGVDAVIVADNRSTDGTRAALSSLADQYPVHVVTDNLEAHIQGAKTTHLAHLARRAGADWVVPFDADELWFAKDRSVAEFLRAVDADIVVAQIHDVFPAADDDPAETDPFLRLRRMDTMRFPIDKVAFRTRRLFKVGEGNMDVTMRGCRREGLYIAHYPWRTYEQLVRKLRNGRRALEQTNFSEETGIHWRVAGAWSDEQLRAAWNKLLAGQPVDELSWSPIGALETCSPGRWTAWELDADGTQPR